MAGREERHGNISDFIAYRAARRVRRSRRDDTGAAGLLELVAFERGVSPADLLDRSRLAHVSAARQLAMYLVYTMLGRTLVEVGAIFGRDRTTVAYACRLIEDRRDEGDARFDAELARLERAAGELATGSMEVRHARG